VKHLFSGGSWCLLLVLSLALGSTACGQETGKAEVKKTEPAGEKPAAEKPAEERPAVEKTPEGLVRFSPKHDVWIDTKRKAVVIDGKICMSEGVLEMFACPKGTKEHESIVAVNCLPEHVHACLLAVGAKQGTPVKFEPEYKPCTGDVIDIFVLWKEADGTAKEVKAQDFIRHAKDGTPMKHDWVFAGSGFYKDEQTGRLHYQANGGDFICVSNFPTATLDLPIESTQANGGLLFELNKGTVPPKGTAVRLILVPRLKKEAKPEEKPDEKPAEKPKAE
jgi:hypothetical protein